ncbi:uncharacterized protein [Leptinotarsa decemlineata]|uniref:uncharacterized protein n=1 Tax=Leptinotarsa decemlineata TaxID=7539 RepID=UPI000C253680|nr:uncharacterized protein LOC111506374 [Leptinotarsa decemlineata]
MKVRFLLVVIFCGTLAQSKLLDTSRHVVARQKRALIWRNVGSNWVQFIFGLGLPFEVKRNAVTLGTVMKAFYLLPTNSSIYTRPSLVIYERKKRSTSRWMLYEILERFLARYNNGDGKSCILKSICEVSHSPLEESTGILAEIVAAVLKPSATEEIFQHPTNMDYVSAEKLGAEVGNCELLYPECKIDILQRFSRFIN